MSLLLGIWFFAVSTASAEELFKLSGSQNISCSRGFARGKLRTATCTSYTYLFNIRTSEYFRCAMSMTVTRKRKEVIEVSSDGRCDRISRIFPTDSIYDFDVAETSPPSLNSIFGQGGYSVWALDTASRRVRGCILIATGLPTNVSKCLDMAFR